MRLHGVESDLRRVALEYARAGFRVHPVRRDKTPHLARGVLDATSDPRLISWFWRRWPQAGIGIATGAGLAVIDVDGPQGAASLAALEREHGPTPATVETLTGGGGRHLWFRSAEPLRNSAGLLGPGLDVRGENGYVVAPPSRHRNGTIYSWKVAPDERRLAPLPAWLRPPERQRPTTAASARAWAGGDDPLSTLTPTDYVPMLLGVELDRAGRALCPFHADRNPSLRAYPTVEQGWCCFAGCGGGTIIDLGARLYRLTPRGRDFHEIRRRLLADLAVRAAA